MIIGALIAGVIGLGIMILNVAYKRGQVIEYNTNRLNQLAGRKASFTPDYGMMFCIIAFYAGVGAIIGYFITG